MEEADDPMPYLGDAGFYAYSQLPRLEVDPPHDVNPPREVPFVPQSIIDEEFQPELPPPPARGPRHIQGEIQLPESVREGILQADEMQPDLGMAPDDSDTYQPPALSEDIHQTQPVEVSTPTMSGEHTAIVPQIGGGGT